MPGLLGHYNHHKMILEQQHRVLNETLYLLDKDILIEGFPRYDSVSETQHIIKATSLHSHATALFHIYFLNYNLFKPAFHR